MCGRVMPGVKLLVEWFGPRSLKAAGGWAIASRVARAARVLEAPPNGRGSSPSGAAVGGRCPARYGRRASS